MCMLCISFNKYLGNTWYFKSKKWYFTNKLTWLRWMLFSKYSYYKHNSNSNTSVEKVILKTFIRKYWHQHNQNGQEPTQNNIQYYMKKKSYISDVQTETNLKKKLHTAFQKSEINHDIKSILKFNNVHLSINEKNLAVL